MSKRPVETVEIVAVTGIEHEQRRYEPGEKLTVPAETARWLVDLGHAELVKEKS